MPGATGTFEVRFDPQVDNGQEAAAIAIGRLIIDKQFRGDLEATSKGQMLSAAGNVPESAGYVAIECVTGKPVLCMARAAHLCSSTTVP